MKVPKIKIGKRTMIAGGAVGALALLGFCTMQNNDAPDAPQPAASDAADAAAERARAERRRGEVTTIYILWRTTHRSVTKSPPMNPAPLSPQARALNQEPTLRKWAAACL